MAFLRCERKDWEVIDVKDQELEEKTSRLYTPGLDNTRLFMSLTAGAGT